MEIDLINWNNSHYWNIAPNSMEFELKLRFPFKFGFGEAGELSTLYTLMQIHHGTNLDKECSKLIFKYFSFI
jgi:hypothetical protein